MTYGACPALCGGNALAGLNDQNCLFMPEGVVEVIITQTPDHGPSQPFNAPGLAYGGEQSWNYVWDFQGLKN